MTRRTLILGLVAFAGLALCVAAPARAGLLYDSTSTDVTFTLGTVVEEGQESSYNSTGTTPFTTAHSLTNLVPGKNVIFSSELGGFEATKVQDGAYPANPWGPSNPWLPTGNGQEWVAVKLGSAVAVKYVAFGTEYPNRSQGTYDVQYTTDAIPSGVSTWTTVATMLSTTTGEGIVGRHLIDVGNLTGVTGVRICGTPDTGLGAASISVSELEVYAVPEPSAIVLSVIGLIGLLAYAWRNRR